MGFARSAVGHLCIDLSHVELTGDEQRELLRTVQEAVVGHLAKVASSYKVVSISLSQNNGAGDRDEDKPQPLHEPDPPPQPPEEPPPREETPPPPRH